MMGDHCAAIASDLRFGVQLQTISTEFCKISQLGPRLFVGFPGLATDNQTVYAIKSNLSSSFAGLNVYNFARMFMN